MREQEIEEEIQKKGLVAPRLTPEYIDDQILAEQFYIFPGTSLTVCALTLQNGFQVIGKSAPVSAENFDEDLGRKISREDARRQIWAFEGYLLKSKLNGSAG